jgi:hypothetical protein
MKKNKLLKVVITMLPMLLLSLWSYAQTVSVKGHVTDNTGAEMPGVNIIIQGTTTGTITDINGNYMIDATPTSTLTFSLIGYESQNIVVGNKTKIDVQLVSSSLDLNEVVVVGYGTSKKSDISGSVASVNTEEMMKKAPTNILQGLQGAAAGVLVTAQDGAPDANAAIRIRGVATINGSSLPLYVVDGVQVGTSRTFINFHFNSTQSLPSYTST